MIIVRTLVVLNQSSVWAQRAQAMDDGYGLTLKGRPRASVFKRVPRWWYCSKTFRSLA